MKKFITKTSTQAQIERKKEQEDTSCPECGYPCLGIVARKEGFFKTQEKNEYRCIECGCEWETEWRNV